MTHFDTFKFVTQEAMTLWMIELDFMGFIVRPIDFLLFTGALTLIVDLFRMVVMRGSNDD